ncbi:MAG: alpha/beta hydrolase [Myxococcales bacterium]|nr:alpha/beta hydrolase [Myxococcales bacterium]
MDAPTLLFAYGLLCALLSVNALRPLYRPSPVAALCFFGGWLVGELALHHLWFECLVGGVLIGAGALREPLGWAGFGLLAVAQALLVVLWVRGREAGPAVEAALAEALGPDWRRAIPPELAARLPAAVEPGRWVVPFRARRPGVEVRRGLEFARLDDGTVLRLALFRPERRTGPCPVLVFVHGGGWVIAHKEFQGLPMLYGLAAQGWLCVSIDYRLSPRATFPDHLVDVKRALAWVRERGAEHGADPSFVVVCGNSAGGHLAALAALTPNDPAYQPGFEAVDTAVAGCVGLYGVYDFVDRDRLWPHRDGLWLVQRVVMKTTPERDPELYARASPIAQVRADAPPFLLLHGTRDSLAPVAGGRAFARALRAVSRHPVVWAEIPGGQHAFEVFHSPRADHALLGVFGFLAWLRGRAGAPAGVSRA